MKGTDVSSGQNNGPEQQQREPATDCKNDWKTSAKLMTFYLFFMANNLKEDKDSLSKTSYCYSVVFSEKKTKESKDYKKD